MDMLTTRLPGLALLALTAGCLALHGLALAVWLTPLLPAPLAIVAAACLALLRVAVAVPAAEVEGHFDRALLAGALTGLGLTALSAAIAPVLPGLMPALGEPAPVLLGTVFLALCFELATRAAVGLTVRHHLPEFRRRWLLRETCRLRETQLVAELISCGLRDEAVLRRSRHELERALARIDQQIRVPRGPEAAATQPSLKEDPS